MIVIDSIIALCIPVACYVLVGAVMDYLEQGGKK